MSALGREYSAKEDIRIHLANTKKTISHDVVIRKWSLSTVDHLRRHFAMNMLIAMVIQILRSFELLKKEENNVACPVMGKIAMQNNYDTLTRDQ